MQREINDWHSAEVKCELAKRGVNLTILAKENGIAPSTLRNVFRVKWPKGERIIAEALNCEPGDIWPSRYQEKVA